MRSTEKEAERPARSVLNESKKKIKETSVDEEACDWQVFLAHFATLRQDTVRLRESVALLEDHTFKMDHLSKSHRKCILRICEVIRKKHDELIYSEKLMREVILQLAPNATI